MSESFHLEIEEPFFTCIKLGKTNVFASGLISGIGHLLPGDTLQFVNYQSGVLQTCNVQILHNRHYNTTRELLEAESFEKCVPDADSIEEAIQYYHTKYTEKLLLKHFARIIEFELIDDGCL